MLHIHGNHAAYIPAGPVTMGVADRVCATGRLSITGQHPFTITSTRFIRRL